MDTIDQFSNLFIRKGSIFSYKKGKDWGPYRKKETSRKLIKNHLDEDIILGQYLPEYYTDSFVLDFDYKKGSDRTEFFNFIKDVINLFQAPRVIFQSSNSGGVHVWFWIQSNRCFYINKRS